MKKKLKTLVILYPNCVEFEIMLATELLNRTFPIEITTPLGKHHKGSNGMKIESDLAYSEVKIKNYKIVLVPGGDPYRIINNKEIDSILQNAVKENKIIGAICAGPFILAKAGILKGKKFTHGYGDLHKEYLDPFWEGAEFIDKNLIVDKNLVTAKAQGNVDFAAEILKLAGVVKDEEKERIQKFYKGLNKN
ncbi:MAG: DJ-1/PfpI family protein [Bacteroidota bacterium]|nr:DJ-1/PfpI family protein [Bacteroidota bacterium]